MFLAVGGSVQAALKVPYSVRFNPPDTPDLSRNVSVTGARRTFTLSAWIKLGSGLGTLRPLFHSNIFSGAYFGLNLTSSDEFAVTDGTSFTTTFPNVKFRDPTAFMHVVLAVNTNNGNSTKFRLYINNVEIANGGTYPGAIDLSWNHNGGSSLAHYIGRAYTGSDRFDGYMSYIHHVDGLQLTPSSFGKIDTATGVWTPKKFTGTYGANGFHLDFADDTSASSSALGKDRSGNNNDFSPTALSVGSSGYDVDRDVYADVPTPYTDGANGRGTFCVLNPLDASASLGSPTLKNGNLEYHYQSAGWQECRGTMAARSGKWYYEVTVTNPGSGGSFIVGLRDPNGRNMGGTWWYNGSWSLGVNGLAYGYMDDARKVSGGSASAYGASFTTGDVIGVALDLDAGTITFYKNNVSQGTAFTGVAGELTPGLDLNNGSHAKCNFGQRPFRYTPPANHNAWNSINLPATVVQGATGFHAATYAGNGSSQSIAGMAFQPDMVWIKQRSSPADSHNLYDSTRGATIELTPDTTGGDATVGQSLTAFNSNGFSVGSDGGVNENTLNYVAWAWEESIAAGLDVRSFTGTGAAQTVSHNLAKVPEFIIYKSRSSSGDFVVGHKDLNYLTTPWNYYLFFTTAAQAASSSAFNNTAPTSSNVTIGGFAGNTVTHIAYIFTGIEGYSNFGSYTGNGSSNGPAVHLGFRPRFLMIKGVSSGCEWKLHDTARDLVNPAGNDLIAGSSAAEAVGSNMLDILANGFKLRGTSSNYNTDGTQYIYAAFAENPFKYARAR